MGACWVERGMCILGVRHMCVGQHCKCLLVGVRWGRYTQSWLVYVCTLVVNESNIIVKNGMASVHEIIDCNFNLSPLFNSAWKELKLHSGGYLGQ